MAKKFKVQDLHRFLKDHPDGVTEADVIVQFDLSTQAARKLLDTQVSQSLVRNVFQDSASPVLYFSEMRTTLADPPEEIVVRNAEDRTTRPNRWPIGIIVAALALSSSVLAWVFLSPDSTPQPEAPLSIPPIPSSEDRIEEAVNAREIQTQVREWQQERADLLSRIEVMTTEGEKCEARWPQPEECYVNGQLLSRSKHREQVLEMELRATQIDGLLSRSTRP